MKAQAPLLYLREEELTDGMELFFFAGRSVSDAMDIRLTELGLGHADFRAMHFVARHPGMPVSDLLGILGITKQSLSRVVRGLTEGGYLMQSAGVSDRRQRLLRLTAKGQAVESELAALQRMRFAKAYREAGPEAAPRGRDYVLGREDEAEEEEKPENGQDQAPVIAEHPAHVERLSVGEAVMRLELAGAPVVMFRNVANSRVNVVYRRGDGMIGWLDPGED